MPLYKPVLAAKPYLRSVKVLLRPNIADSVKNLLFGSWKYIFWIKGVGMGPKFVHSKLYLNQIRNLQIFILEVTNTNCFFKFVPCNSAAVFLFLSLLTLYSVTILGPKREKTSFYMKLKQLWLSKNWKWNSRTFLKWKLKVEIESENWKWKLKLEFSHIFLRLWFFRLFFQNSNLMSHLGELLFKSSKIANSVYWAQSCFPTTLCS